MFNIEDYLGNVSMSIVEAMEKIDSTGAGILFITKNKRLVGAITDGDIRRWLIQTGKLDAKVMELANMNPICMAENEREKAFRFMVKRKLRALPLLNDKGEIVEILFNSYNANSEIQSKELENVPVVIMAGGKGTRLYPYTRVLPKPLIPIGEKPILEHVISSFRKYGCNDFYLILNHKKNMIKAYFNEMDHDYQIHFLEETKPLGTGGGVRLLKGIIDSTFILTNCDILIEDDFSRIYQYHKEKKNDISMVCSMKSFHIPYGVVNLGENGTIQSMDEKPSFTFMTNTGCYFVEPNVIDTIKKDREVGFPEIMQENMNAGNKVGIYPISEYAWLDMGEPDGMERMNQRIGSI